MPGHQEDALPRVFGPYVLVQRIGGGGMAEIYLARRTGGLGVQRRVAIKRIHSELSDDARFSQLLTAEATMASNLNNSRVVQVVDLGRAEGQLYIAMEYVEGWDLHRLLVNLSKSDTALAPAHAFHIVLEMLRGLDYAHRARDVEGNPLELVHRDVSPSNVLVSVEGEVKLCDFGIAKAFHKRQHEVRDAPSILHTQVAGKLAYMAPEVVRGESGDVRSDVYSVGIVLWELCAGRPLNRGERETVRERALRAEWPPLPTRPVRDIERLQAIIDRALLPDPNLRYPSARDFLEALEDFVADEELGCSAVRFGRFLEKHFAEPLIEERRASEQAARVLLDSLPPEGGVPSEVSGVRPVIGGSVQEHLPAHRPAGVATRPSPAEQSEEPRKVLLASAQTRKSPPVPRQTEVTWPWWAALLGLAALFIVVYIILSNS